MSVVLGKNYAGQDCVIARTLEIVGERWTLLVVRDAFYGVQRFNDFRDHLDIPSAVLSERLRGLVRHGLLLKRADPDRPSRDLYELTDAGRALWPTLYALRSWGLRYARRSAGARTFSHATCGASLDAVGACACGYAPPPDEVVTAMPRRSASGRTDHVSAALAKPRRLLTPLV